MHALSLVGRTAEDVTDILITHGHGDHTAGCHLFPNARIVVGAADKELAEGRVRAAGPVPSLMLAMGADFEIDEVLADGDAIYVGKQVVTAYHVPGHTAGSMAYLVEDVLLFGDSLNVSEDEQLLSAPWVFSDDVAQNESSLRALGLRLYSDGVVLSWFVPSHSGAISADLNALIHLGE